MTAINTLVHENVAYMMTDTAAYDGTGRLTAFEDKAFVSARLKAAISISGFCTTSREIEWELREHNSFDQLMREFPDWLRDTYSDLPEERRIRVMLAGWSDEQKRAEIYTLQSKRTTTTTGTVIEPFTVKKGDWVSLQPGPTMDELRAEGIIAGELKVEDPTKFLTGVIDWQRRYHWQEDGTHRVGGMAVLTRIDASGISQRVVRRWNDQIGEMIDPSRDAVPMTAIVKTESNLDRLAGLSPLKRQMLLKKEQKAARRRA